MEGQQCFTRGLWRLVHFDSSLTRRQRRTESEEIKSLLGYGRAMDGLTLSECRLQRSFGDPWKERNRHPSRLPTPEASTGSSSSTGNASPRDFQYRPQSLQHHGHLEADYEFNGRERRDSRRLSAPQSPRHQTVDNGRPKLPPLKTVKILYDAVCRVEV